MVRAAGLSADVRLTLCRIVSREGEMRIEALTMSLLVALTRHAGATVTREQLVRDCWQGRFVSDDAITRAISKVRALTRQMTPAPFLLETVPKVGYRLVPAPAPTPVSAPPPAPAHRSATSQSRRWLSAALAVGVAALAILGMATLRGGQSVATPAPAASPEGGILAADFVDAMLHLDEQRLDLYLKRGWKPSWNLDSEGSSALTYLMLVCERNRTHDQGRLKRVAQRLVAAGVDPDYRNKWGDSALIIARSPKYCGPNHPVVPYLQSIAPASGEYLPEGR